MGTSMHNISINIARFLRFSVLFYIFLLAATLMYIAEYDHIPLQERK